MFGLLISAVLIFLMARNFDSKDWATLTKQTPSVGDLLEFIILAWMIMFAYGYRWQLILSRRITISQSVMLCLMSVGGNNFLPARGGDIYRIYKTRKIASMPAFSVISCSLIEKTLELFVIFFIGCVACFYLIKDDNSHLFRLLVFIMLLCAVSGLGLVYMLRYYPDPIVSLGNRIAKKLGKATYYEEQVARQIREFRHTLRLDRLLRPALITVVLWLSLCAWSYMLAASCVGIQLSYPESLWLLFAGALGLMLPAAPSGLGTFHAAIVSGYVVLGRDASEGMLLAIAIHLLFLTVYGIPALVIYLFGHDKIKYG